HETRQPLARKDLIPGQVEEIGPWAQQKCGAPTLGELRGGAIATILEARSFGRHSSCTGSIPMPRPIIAAAGALLLIAGVLFFAAGEHQNSQSVAPLATPVPSATGILAATATPVPTSPPISDGYRIQIPRLAIDLPIAEGDIERDVVVQQTPENFAFHLPGA